jgi:hypothetical protein
MCRSIAAQMRLENYRHLDNPLDAQQQVWRVVAGAQQLRDAGRYLGTLLRSGGDDGSGREGDVVLQEVSLA